MKKPYITVIIPAYNEEKYIRKALESVINQETDYKYEIIVGNNNSTDNTKKVANSYRVKVIDVKKQGTAPNKNACSKIARGEILIFFDSDSIMPKDHVQRVGDFFKKNKGISALGGSVYYYDLGKTDNLKPSTFNFFYIYFKILKLLTGVQSASGSNMAIRKKIFEQINGFEDDFDSPLIPEDLEITIKLENEENPLHYDKELPIYTSSRRMKNNTNDTITRLINTVKIIQDYKD